MKDKGLIAILPVLVACRQIVGIEPRQVFDGGTSDVGALACRLPSGGAACDTCMPCCDQAVACANDPACSVTEACRQDCAYGDSVCQLGCSKKWDPDLVQGTLQACREADCADECVAGRWDCLGQVQWSRPVVPPTITIRAIAKCSTCGSGGAIGSIEGVHVKVCSTADAACAAALASDDSGPDGSVKLTVVTQNRALSVFLEFRKAGWLDAVLLNTPPLSDDFDIRPLSTDSVSFLMYQKGEVEQIARDLRTTYDPSLAIAFLRVADCNLRQDNNSDIGLTGQHGEVFLPYDQVPFGSKPWTGVSVNLPIPDNGTTRVVARLKQPPTMIAQVNLVLRPGATTIAPFVTPTP